MTQPALKTTVDNSAAVVDDAPIPKLKAGYILAETRAVGVNPTDWKHMRRLAHPGATLGCDWSGVVVKVGEGVTKFKPGDEVLGIAHGGNSMNSHGGAFARFITCAEFVTFHKPASMSFEEAATMGVGLITTGQTMFYIAKLPLPAAENLKRAPTRDVLVYGGSSATGTLAIQMAKLAGCRVISTSSPSNFPLLKSRGADHVFSSYDSEATIPAIRSLISPKDGLHYICDCIGNESSVTFCEPLLSRTGPSHYHSIQYPVNPKFKELRPEENVRATSALGYTMLGEPFEFLSIGKVFEGDEQETAWARDVWSGVVEKLLAEGLITPHPIHARTGGLQDVLAGIEEIERGEAPSGKKLVYVMKW